MSGIAELIRAGLKAKKMNQQALAEKIGLTQPAVSKILNKPDHKPELDTLALIAIALEIPLGELITAGGYELGQLQSPLTADERLTKILSVSPELRNFFLQMIDRLTPEDRDFVLGYMDAAELKRQQKKA